MEITTSGKCPFTDHHEGIFSRKKVMKWHVCKKCLGQEGVKRMHSEVDLACPLSVA